VVYSIGAADLVDDDVSFGIWQGGCRGEDWKDWKSWKVEVFCKDVDKFVVSPGLKSKGEYADDWGEITFWTNCDDVTADDQCHVNSINWDLIR
jgi:hypothetical protein